MQQYPRLSAFYAVFRDNRQKMRVFASISRAEIHLCNNVAYVMSGISLYNGDQIFCPVPRLKRTMD